MRSADSDLWHYISGAEEQERRATSALLAVLTAVREFGRGLTQPLGAPAGAMHCLIEVPFMLGEKRVYPDGLIRISRGQKTWTTLVEVETGTNELQVEQLENYLDVAKAEGFDALITISNQSRQRLDNTPRRWTSASSQEGRAAPLVLEPDTRRGCHAEGAPGRRQP